MNSQWNMTLRSIKANYLEEDFITDGNSIIKFRTQVAIIWPHFEQK